MRTSRLNYSAAITLLLAIATMASLIYAGRWELDEFNLFSAYQTGGFSAFLQRLTSWSPRPFSETTIYIYMVFVRMFGDQLTSQFLIANWALFLAATLLPVAFVDKSSKSPALVMQLSVAVLLIYGVRNNEMLYWAMGAAAYMPTLACMILTVGMVTLTGLTTTRQLIILASALLIGALSSESGTFFAGSFSGMMLLFWLVSHKARGVPKASGFWIFGTIVIGAAWVMASLYFGRVANSSEDIFSDVSKSGNISLALQTSIANFPRGLFLFSETTLPSEYEWLGLPTKLALFFSSALLFMRSPTNSASIYGAAALLFAGVSASILVSSGQYYQFGGACCDRHLAMVAANDWIIVVAIAKITAIWMVLSKREGFESARKAIKSAPIIVAITAMVPVLLITPMIIDDFKKAGKLKAAQEQVWSTGIGPGPAIIVDKIPPGKVIGGGYTYLADGSYLLSDRPDWTILIMMRAFNKRELVATQHAE